MGVWDAKYSSDDPTINTRMQEVADPTDSLEFQEDGSAVMKVGGLTVNGNYKQNGDTVTFSSTTEDGETKSHDMKLSANGESMSGVMNLVRVELTRR